MAKLDAGTSRWPKARTRMPFSRGANALEVHDGKGFTTVLSGLEECGYIRRYENPYRKGRKTMFQLVDPFLLFSMRIMGKRRTVGDWGEYYDTPSYNAWRGNAFEIACVGHLPQIERALSLASMRTRAFPWNSSKTEPGAQINLVIERPDKITYLCEMKYTNAPFAVEAACARDLEHKRDVFKAETGTTSSVQFVAVAAAGVKSGKYSDLFSWAVSGDDLFAF